MSIAAARRLGRPQVQDLPREVPVVERLGGVEALVALQPYEVRAGRGRQRLRERRLADARLAFEEERPAEAQRQEAGRRQPLVGQVAGRRQRVGEGGGRVERHEPTMPAESSAPPMPPGTRVTVPFS